MVHSSLEENPDRRNGDGSDQVPTSADNVPSPSPGQARRVAAATLIGSAIEWYDFYAYGTSAALVFGELFFPDTSPQVGTLLAFVTFATGWFCRPLGGLIAGHFGDRVGRKTMLVLTMFLMGLATMLIGALPTYAAIGIWAPVSLVLLRIIQGLALGGEYGGAVVMAVESARAKRRGLGGSWPQIGAPLGLLIGTIVFYLLTTNLSDDSFMSWGWRIPFLSSAVLVIVGLVIRLKVIESPVFVAAKAKGEIENVPALKVVRHHWRSVLLMIAACIPNNTFFYTFVTFIVSYGTDQLGFAEDTILLAVSFGVLIEIFTLPTFALLSDRVGRKPVYIGGCLFLAVMAYPLFWMVRQGSVPLLFLAIAVCLAIGVASVFGPQASFFTSFFPPALRYSGLSMGYQVAGAIFGGPLPLIATGLIAANSGQPWLFAGFLLVSALVSAVAAYFAPKSATELEGRMPALSPAR